MGLSDHDYLQVTEALVKKWAELIAKEIREDMADLDQLERIDSLYVRSYWTKHSALMLKIHKVLKKTKDPTTQLELIAEMYGDQIGLPSSELKADVTARLDWLKRRTAKEFEREIKKAIDLHGIASPIEQIFLMEWKFARVEHRLGLRLVPQKKIQTQRGEFDVDFVVMAPDNDNPCAKLAIELDGHQFHEKTALQATRDKARERAILSSGIPVLRFSGYEIVRDARACVREVEDFLAKNRI